MTITDRPRVSPSLASPLVSTQWLADHLGSEGLVVLDATVVAGGRPSAGWQSGLDEYVLGGHIPGAVFADLIEVFSDPAGSFGFARPSLAQFERAAASVGVDNDTTVVVYDAAAGQWAARVWWLFRAFGYDSVAVLDGGYTKWTAEERPTESGSVLPRPDAVFSGVERPELWATKADVAAIVAQTAGDAGPSGASATGATADAPATATAGAGAGATDAMGDAGAPKATLVFAGPATDFTGETSPRARAGHIPGSVSVPLATLLDRETKALLKPAALRERLAPALTAPRGVDAQAVSAATGSDLEARAAATGRDLATRAAAPRIVTYCGSGIAAASAALALTVLGEGPVAVYDGSLNEWAADPDAPLVT